MPTVPTTLDELCDLLHRIESGTTPVTPDEDPRAVFCGDITYRTPDGWQVVVFNDCDEFDYIDHVIAPDGRIFTWGDIRPISELLMCWRPNPATSERIWRLPS